MFLIKNIKKIALLFIISISFFIFDNKLSFSLFSRDYQKKLGLGAYKKMYTSDIYVVAEVGLLLHSWQSNVSTAIAGNGNLTSYKNSIPNQINQNLKGKYNYYIKSGLGFNSENSNFRHELTFQWYSFLSKTIDVVDNVANVTNADGTITPYNYSLLGNRLATNVGIYGNIYKIMYNLNYDFKNVFTLLKMNWDIFISIGFGLAIINSGFYTSGELKQVANNDGTYTTTYNGYKVGSSTDAKKYNIDTQESLGIAYNATIGTIINMSQSFAATLGFGFNATTRPLLTTKFKRIDKAEGIRAHLEYNISLQLGVLIKAFEIKS